MNINEVIISTESYAQKRYIEYAVATIKDRSLPYINDGLKPVHRRILYAMLIMGIKAKEKPKKSARIVGDVIGKYHPHGDTSVYEALVAMAQPWKMRYPLIASQGNFGSRDGDRAAAMRYTEAGLTPLAEEMLLSEMKEGTCDYRVNFDGSMEEVVLLPSRLNNLLLNGSFGIAVGLATNIPSHNMRELTAATLAYIENNDITIPELLEHIQGPDFATGGQIITPKEKILEAYEKGNGAVRIRCKWHVEKQARNQWRIIITELPPEKSVVDVLNRIEKITNPIQTKENGKLKPLPQKILQDKQFVLSILSGAANESDKNDNLRLALEPKSSRQDPEEMMKSLYSILELEENFNFNLNTVNIDRMPEKMNLKKYISQWVDYRRIVLRRRFEFHLAKAQKRLHILEGRLKVYLDLDKAISIIKNSEDPKTDLINEFGLTEVQAEDILEIKLRQLAKLEKDKLDKEYDKLKKEEDRLMKILNSETRFKNILVKEIQDITDKYGDDRRTLIQEAEEASTKRITAIKEEPVTVIYTKKGWLTLRKGHDVDTSTISLKDGDEFEKVMECKNTDKVVFLDSNGRGYSIIANSVPSGKNYVHINSLVDSGDSTIVEALLTIENKKYLFANSEGYGFISNVENLVSKNKAGKHFMKTKDSSTVIFKPLEFTEENSRLNVLTSDHRLLSFDISQVKELDKGKGVQLVRIKTGHSIRDIAVSNKNELPVFIKQKKKIYRDEELIPFDSNRARRGKLVDENFTLVGI